MRIVNYWFESNTGMEICRILCIDGLEQDCSSSIANALELLQSCTKPPRYLMNYSYGWCIICPSAIEGIRKNMSKSLTRIHQELGYTQKKSKQMKAVRILYRIVSWCEMLHFDNIVKNNAYNLHVFWWILDCNGHVIINEMTMFCVPQSIFWLFRLSPKGFTMCVISMA